MTKEILVENEKKEFVSDNVQIFENQEFGKVRTILIDYEPWFVGKDVAEILGYKSSADAVRVHTDEDDKGVYELKTPGGIQKVVIINESGLYSLILSSKLESAKKFKKWVASEVLPSIRKTGKYEIPVVSKKSQLELENEAEKLKLEKAKFWRELGFEYSDNTTYKQILDAYSTKAIEGTFILPLPVLEEKNYSATEVGQMLGISANKVGSVANKLGIKTDEYGKWYVDKSKYSNKEVNTFRYNQKGVDLIKNNLK